MGGKGKTSPVASNQQLVQMQTQQAEEAKQANIERTARLQQGMTQITDIFQGHPADAQLLDLSSITEGSPGAITIPAGASAATGTIFGNQAWDDNLKTWVDTGTGLSNTGGDNSGYTWSQLPSSGGDTQYGIYDAEGNLVTSANSPEELAKAQIWYGGNADSEGRTGGFENSFYDKFRQSVMDYYMPQEAEQYSDARSKLAYTLARAGQTNSSVANMDVAKLSEQDQLNRAQIASQADTQTAGVRRQVEDAQQQAINQLYSTEDPTVAANTAQNLVANAQLTVPDLNPAGAMFAPIVAGVGNAISGFTNPYAYINTGSPSVSSPKQPDQSSGVPGQGY